MLKRLLFLIRFYLWDIPRWIPKRIFWKLKRRKCIKKGCNPEILVDGDTGKTVMAMCSRCRAYEDIDGNVSDHPIIRKT